MRLDQLHQPVVDLLPDLGGHHGFQRRVRYFQHQIARALVAGVDDRDLGRGRAVRRRSDQQVRDRLDWILCRGQPDADQVIAAQCGQAFQRQGQMCPALVRRHGVDFIDDHGARGRQHRATGAGAEQDVQRLRCGDEDVRRATAHAFTLAGRRVAGAHPGADLDIGQAALAQRGANAGERFLQVALDVVGQRLQRRDIDHLRGVGEIARQPLADQPVDRRQKRGQRLAGPGRSSDQRMPASLDRRPRLGLRRGRRCKAVGEPRRDGGMKQGHWAHGSNNGQNQIKDQTATKSIRRRGHRAAQSGRSDEHVRSLVAFAFTVRQLSLPLSLRAKRSNLGQVGHYDRDCRSLRSSQ